MNEENGLRGSLKYKEIADKEGVNHIFAIESDAGGFRPLGFSFTCNDSNFLRILEWKKLFAPYCIPDLEMHIILEMYDLSAFD